jgi:hypothetical protein
VKLAKIEELLCSTHAPHVIQLLRADDEFVHRLEAAGHSVVHLDGASMRAPSQAFVCFGAAFRFPSSVANYAGFEDWMRDLSWLNTPGAGWVVLIRNARHLLGGERSQRDTLLSSLAAIGGDWAKPVSQGEWWDRPAIPFHTLLIG